MMLLDGYEAKGCHDPEIGPDHGPRGDDRGQRPRREAGIELERKRR